MPTALATRFAICLLLGGCAAAPGRGLKLAAANERSAVAEQRNAVVPDAELQTLIDRLVYSSPDDLKRSRLVARIRDIARSPGARHGAEKHVIEQAALYAAHARRITDEEHINDVPDGRMAVHYVRRLMDVTEPRVAEALAPHLSSDDRRLREFIFESVLRGGTPTFEETLSNPISIGLAQVVSRDLQAPPWDAAQVLYWKAPSAAVMEFANRLPEAAPRKRQTIRDAVAAVVNATAQPESYAGGPVVAEDPKSPSDMVVFTPRARDRESIRAAIDQLDRLSRFDEWWVKLYVAEMMRRYDRKPDLRDGDIVARLRKDKNPVIAKAADVPFHHGKTANERVWWWPFMLEDERGLKHLWRPERRPARK